MNVTLTRAARAAVLVHPSMRTEPAEPAERVVWVDPAELRHFGVHTGGTGEEDPERVAVNSGIRLSIRENGFDPTRPPLLVVDRAGGRAVLKDGNHRTNFAADEGVDRIPVRVREDRISPRFPHFPYHGQFDTAPVIL